VSTPPDPHGDLGPEEHESWEERAQRLYAEMLAQPVLEVTAPDAAVAFAFELIQAARGFEYHLARAAEGHAMTALQARFAWILATSPWAIPMPQIEAALGLSHAGVSRMVARMRSRELVSTEPNIYDARCSLVSLTAKGKREWEAIKADIAAVSEELGIAVGPRAEVQFRAQLAGVERLDDRYQHFASLRNPSMFPP
jgi:DNA-binding MarR family transcriptional regulator